MDVNVLFKERLIDEGEDLGTIDRRRVIRAISDVRRRLEDERGLNCNFIDPRIDLLLDLVSKIGFSTIEAIEALGAEIISDRIWATLIPELPFGDFQKWETDHQGATLATVMLKDFLDRPGATQ